MFTSYEKSGAQSALLILATAGDPQNPAEARRLLDAMNDLRSYYSRLQSRASILLGDYLEIDEFEPDNWAASEHLAFVKLLYPINVAVAALPDDEEDEGSYSFIHEHAFGAADYGVGRAAA